MKEFDYIIIGGGCAGLSLAYELDIHEKLKDKTLAIIEPRSEYKKDKTWSFWKVAPHNFDDCIKKSWENFSINIPGKTNFLECKSYPYQSIDSGLFYEKINNRLKENKNISFFKDINEINTERSLIFNSVPNKGEFKDRLILNHVIAFYNVFEHYPATRIWFTKINRKHWGVLNSVLTFLGYMPRVIHGINGVNLLSDDLPIDEDIYGKLKEL